MSDPKRKRTHGRQASAQGDSLDEKSEDLNNSFIKIQRKLDLIPPEYKKKENFNPLEHVIDIMKASNSKERKKELIANCKAMDKAMVAIVKVHYEGFNKAIKNYTQILNNVDDSTSHVQLLKENSEMCTALFSSRSHSVNNMYIQKLEYTYMIEILDKMYVYEHLMILQLLSTVNHKHLYTFCSYYILLSENIKNVPDKLHEYVSKKMYLEAATLLVDADRELNQDDLLKIGALSDKYEEIISKKNNFHETLLDNIHDIIYLKDEENEDNHSHRHSLNRAPPSQTDHQEDITSKTQTINALVSALFVLEKQNVAVHTILSRLRPDLRSMIQKVIISVKNSVEGSNIIGQKSNDDAELPLFTKMLNIVFEKCKNILVNHRYVCSLFEEKFSQLENTRTRKQTEFHDYTQTHKIFPFWGFQDTQSFCIFKDIIYF